MKGKTVVVLGSTGMLGKALVNEAREKNIKVIGLSRSSKNTHIDITDEKILRKLIKQLKPDVIINSAALVSIEECEKNPGLAYLVNAKGAGLLADIARELDAYFIHISTDQYFIGDKDKRHSEEDNVVLLNEYARTKYAGEAFVLRNAEALVVRTNIVGFRNKRDRLTFVEWIIKTLKTNQNITLFTDYFVSSIHVKQLAVSLFNLLQKKPAGILNIGSSEVFSKKEFIIALAKSLNLSLANAKNGSCLDGKMVPRAESDGLDVSKAEKIIGYSLPTLTEVVQSLKKEYLENNYAL